MRRRLCTTAAGTHPTAPSSASRSTGTRSTSACAGANATDKLLHNSAHESAAARVTEVVSVMHGIRCKSMQGRYRGLSLMPQPCLGCSARQQNAYGLVIRQGNGLLRSCNRTWQVDCVKSCNRARHVMRIVRVLDPGSELPI